MEEHLRCGAMLFNRNQNMRQQFIQHQQQYIGSPPLPIAAQLFTKRNLKNVLSWFVIKFIGNKFKNTNKQCRRGNSKRPNCLLPYKTRRSSRNNRLSHVEQVSNIQSNRVNKLSIVYIFSFHLQMLPYKPRRASSMKRKKSKP